MTSATPAGDDPEPVAPPAEPGAGRTLAEGLAGHRNSLGILRLVFASAVIFSHAFYLIGLDHDPFLDLVRGQESIGGIAVLGFFAISGYLITKSGVSTDALSFIWRRALRILPAFWTVLVVAALVVGPTAWLIMGRPLATYFTLEPWWPRQLPGRKRCSGDQPVRHPRSLRRHPVRRARRRVFNGSLWTLDYEWGAYLIVWALVIFAVLRRAPLLVPVLTAFYFVLEVASRVVPGGAGLIFPYFGDHYRVTLTLIFLYGACLALYARKVPLDWRFAVLAACLVVGSLAAGGFTLIGYPALAYLVLWVRRCHARCNGSVRRTITRTGSMCTASSCSSSPPFSAASLGLSALDARLSRHHRRMRLAQLARGREVGDASQGLGPGTRPRALVGKAACTHSRHVNRRFRLL